MYNKRETEIMLFLEENGFVERYNSFCKDVEDNVSVLVKDLNAIVIDFRVFYFKSNGNVLDVGLIFVFDKKLILDLCEISKKLLIKLIQVTLAKGTFM